MSQCWPDRAPWAFAGLYSAWRPKNDPDAALLLSCTILTMAASPVVEPVHARMPIILDPAHELDWLDPQRRDRSELAALLVPDATPLDALAVSTRVNAPRNDGPELIAQTIQAGSAPALPWSLTHAHARSG